MKKTLFNYALIIASALCLAGCEEYEYEQFQTQQFKTKVKYYNPTIGVRIYSIEIEGHDYILFNGYRKGGITHSASCPCKKEDNDESNR